MTTVRSLLASARTWRVLAVVVAVVAAWGPRVGGADGTQRVVLFDASASADTTSITPADIVAGCDADDTLRVVVFGEGTAVVPEGGDADPTAAADSEILLRVRDAPVRSHASDLAEALLVASSLPRDGRDRELLLVGDLRSTSAAAAVERATLAMNASGGATLRTLETPTRVLDPRVVRLSGPGSARPGQVVHLVADGHAGTTGGRLQLIREGHVIDARDVPPGPFRVRFTARPDPERQHTGRDVYSARFAGGPERPVPRAVVNLEAPGSVLILRHGRATPLESSVESVFAARVVQASLDEPGWEQRLSGHDVAVLVGAAPSRRARRALSSWVAEGGGLLLVGDVVWDGVSPLRSRPPGDPGTYLYVAIDGSGSMREPWSGGDGRTRDDVVRAAVRALGADAGKDVWIALRRFNEQLQPKLTSAWIGRPADDIEAFDAAVDALPAPAGGTLLLPALAEAERHVRARPQRSRRALVFTDGRVADDPAALVDAVRQLADRRCGLTVVVDNAEGHDLLSRVLADTSAEIVLVRDAARLGETLHEAADRALPEPDVRRNMRLRAGPAVGEIPGIEIPETVSAFTRRWIAHDAGSVIDDVQGAPVVALRRHGLGRVAALASHPTSDWPRAEDGPLLRALRGTVEGRPGERARVERADGRLLVGVEPHADPRTVEFGGEDGVSAVDVELFPAGDGLFSARIPARDASEIVTVRFAGDEEPARVGLDRPAAPEYRDPQPVDVAALQRAIGPPQTDRGVSLRPWLAICSVLLVLLGHLLASRGLSSRLDDLPM